MVVCKAGKKFLGNRVARNPLDFLLRSALASGVAADRFVFPPVVDKGRVVWQDEPVAHLFHLFFRPVDKILVADKACPQAVLRKFPVSFQEIFQGDLALHDGQATQAQPLVNGVAGYGNLLDLELSSQGIIESESVRGVLQERDSHEIQVAPVADNQGFPLRRAFLPDKPDGLRKRQAAPVVNGGKLFRR